MALGCFRANWHGSDALTRTFGATSKSALLLIGLLALHSRHHVLSPKQGYGYCSVARGMRTTLLRLLVSVFQLGWQLRRKATGVRFVTRAIAGSHSLHMEEIASPAYSVFCNSAWNEIGRYGDWGGNLKTTLPMWNPWLYDCD